MTNKPMLSVDLRKALADFIEYSVPGPLSDDAMWYADKKALRALLDKEVDGYYHAPKSQGEPVSAILLGDCEEGVMQDYGHVFFATDDCVKQLYAEQPAPVEMVRDAERFNFLMSAEVLNGTPRTSNGWIDFEFKDEALKQLDACIIKAKQSALIPAMRVALAQSQTDLQEGRTVSVEQLRDNLAAKFIGKKP